MTALDLLAIGLTLGYGVVQLYFLVGWRATPQVQFAKAPLQRRWSVVIAARNEEATLPRCLASLAALEKVEVLVVDDHSIDQTAEVALAASAELLVLPKGVKGKKAALSYGISRATGDWIATLDADVQVPQHWLQAIDGASQNMVAVTGPVALAPTHTWFERWQALDFCGMMAITAASLHHGHFAMGNGANLAFAKTAFDAVGGYASPTRTEAVSGDDMVLLGKLMLQYPQQLAFAKTPHATVRTPPQGSVASFVRQRLRWSAKTGLNHQSRLTFTLGLVWVFHLGLLLGIAAAALGYMKWQVLLGAWLVKLLIDFLLLKDAVMFFRKEKLLDISYPLGSILHAVYVAGVGLLALLPINFEWKGRQHRV